MLVYVGTVLIIAQLGTGIFAFVKKQKKTRLISICLAVLAIVTNVALAVYYNAISSNYLWSYVYLREFLIACLQAIVGAVLLLIMAIGFEIQGRKNREAYELKGMKK